MQSPVREGASHAQFCIQAFYTHDPLRTSTAPTQEKSPNLDRASLLPATPLLVALIRLRIFSRTQRLSLQAQRWWRLAEFNCLGHFARVAKLADARDLNQVRHFSKLRTYLNLLADSKIALCPLVPVYSLLCPLVGQSLDRMDAECKRAVPPRKRRHDANHSRRAAGNHGCCNPTKVSQPRKRVRDSRSSDSNDHANLRASS